MEVHVLMVIHAVPVMKNHAVLPLMVSAVVIADAAPLEPLAVHLTVSGKKMLIRKSLL